MYDKGDIVCKETAVVTGKSHGFMALEESNKMSVESMDIITTRYDTVDQGCVRLSESG